MGNKRPFPHILTKLKRIKRRFVWILVPLALTSVLFLGCLFNQLDPQIWSREYLEQILRDSDWFAPFIYIILILLLDKILD